MEEKKDSLGHSDVTPKHPGDPTNQCLPRTQRTGQVTVFIESLAAADQKMELRAS